MKLKRPKGFEASAYQLPVMVQNTEYAIANLKKSGAILNHIVLFGYEDKWHEINIESVNLNSSDLEAFKIHLETNNYTLQQLGVITKEQALKYEPPEKFKHEDYERLEKLFPEFDYYKISQFHRFISKHRYTPFAELRATLTRMSKDKQTIESFMEKYKDSEDYNAAKLFYEKPKASIPKPPLPPESDSAVIEGLGYGTLGFMINNHGVVLNPDELYRDAFITLSVAQLPNSLWGYGFNLLGSGEGESRPVSIGEFKTQTECTQAASRFALDRLAAYIRKGSDQLKNSFITIQNLLNNMSQETTIETTESISAITSIDQRTELLEKLNFVHNKTEDVYVGYGFTVTGNSIENDSEEEWQNQMDRIQGFALEQGIPEVAPQPESSTEAVALPEPPKRAMSIEVIGNLPADKIQEFKDLNKETEKLIKANPIIEVVDKATLEKAKKNRAAMLKACTSIDGATTGLAATTRKAFNTVKATFDTFLTSVAGKRREHYNLLDAAVNKYEKAEELRIAAEREAATRRTVERTQQLFDVPMVFNGAVYTIGTLHVLPSTIESATDQEFLSIVNEAKVLKQAQDLAAQATQSQADKIRLLEEELAKLRGDVAPLTGETAESIAAPLPPEATPELTELKSQSVDNDRVATPTSAPQPIMPVPSTATPQQQSSHPYGYVPGTEFIASTSGPLADFDKAHAHIIALDPIPPAFIKCREYFKMGLLAAGMEIEAIFNKPSDTVPTKPEQMKNLCKTLQS